LPLKIRLETEPMIITLKAMLFTTPGPVATQTSAPIAARKNSTSMPAAPT